MNVGEGKTKCFWLEPTGEVRVQLRRFAFGVSMDKEGVWQETKASHRPCSGQKPYSYESGGAYWSGCNASLALDKKRKLKTKTDDDGWKTLALVPKSWIPPRKDPSWPQTCEHCDLPFEEDDQWQANQLQIYVRTDTGDEITERHHFGGKEMAGALSHAWWREGYSRIRQGETRTYCGPDGICLQAVCPNGTVWEVDGPASNGGGWTRTGDPREPETLTVQPSILAGDYHGFLQQGWFTAHVG